MKVLVAMRKVGSCGSSKNEAEIVHSEVCVYIHELDHTVQCNSLLHAS